MAGIAAIWHELFQGTAQEFWTKPIESYVIFERLQRGVLQFTILMFGDVKAPSQTPGNED